MTTSLIDTQTESLRLQLTHASGTPLADLASTLGGIQAICATGNILQRPGNSSGPMARQPLIAVSGLSAQGPRVEKLALGSPLDMTLVGDSKTLVFVWWVMTHPEQTGSWLPRLVRSWRSGWASESESDLAERALRAQLGETSSLVRNQLGHLPLEEVVSERFASVASYLGQRYGVIKAELQDRREDPPLPGDPQ